MAKKSRGNIVVTYNSNNITAYCKQTDMDATIERLETTNLASTAKTTIAGDPEWKISLSGDWENALDAIIGVDAVTPGTARTASIAYTGTSATVTYTWTSNAEIQNFKVSGQVGQTTGWSADLALSGAPTRTSA